ncbi:MAG: glutamine synthetase family protein [Chromatiales bacterium]
MAQKRESGEARRFLTAHPAVQCIDLLIADINGCQRGKRVRRDALAKVWRDGICLPGSLYGLDITGTTVEASGLGFAIGDADYVCRPVLNRLTTCPWHDPPTAQVLLAMRERDGTGFFADPRAVLTEVAERFRALRLRPVVAVELEFYLVDRRRTRSGKPQPPLSPVTGEREASTQVYGMKEIDDYATFLEDVRRAAEAQGLPADTAVSEYAPGQYEVNLRHRADPVAACDDAFLLKRLLKGVANRHGMEATFMAKPYEELAGSGLHIHLSLANAQGRNAFAAERLLQQRLLRHAVGGLKATMIDATAIFAPTANSYRRYRAGAFVPMAPTWGVNNRTLALRIPAGQRATTRIEHRVSGADANPYTVMAAVLAGAHYGIVNRLDPGVPTEGNAYTQHPPTLPRYWSEALRTFEKSKVMRHYLGERFCRVYSACRWHECEAFNAAVTPREYDWYLRSV